MSLMFIRFAVCLAVAAGLYAAVGGAMFYVGKLQEDIQQLTANNQKLETSFQQQTVHLEALETARKNAIVSRDRLADDLLEAEEQRQIIAQKYNNYRGRLENAALKKPETIERYATDAINGLMLDIAKATRGNNNPGSD